MGCYYGQTDLGSSASRRPSPSRLELSTSRKIARPGRKKKTGSEARNVTESVRMLPSVGVGAGTPTPRKDRAASALTLVGKISVPYTRIGAHRFGRSSVNQIR